MNHSLLNKNLRKFSAVLFDFDGVIGDTMADNFTAWKDAFDVHGVSIDSEDYYAREGLRAKDYAEYFVAKHGLPPDKTAGIADAKAKRFKEIHKPRLYPDALALLDWLVARDISFGIVSGGTLERLKDLLPENIVKACGIIMHAENTKKPKPDPQPFLAAAEALGILPEHCLVIENAPFGITAAREAGMQCVAVTTTLSAEKLKEADAVFASVGDIQKVLVELLRK